MNARPDPATYNPATRKTFHIRNLFDIRYLYRAVRSIESWEDFRGRLRNFMIFLGKVITLRYGEKYWERQGNLALENLNKKNAHQKLFQKNVELNDKELFRADVCEAKPRSLHIFMTTRCNLRCIMCNVIYTHGNITLPENVFEKLLPLIKYAQSINWQGGEVFAVSYFKQWLRRIKEENLSVRHSVTTNGLLLKNDWPDLLAETGFQIGFSIDSITPATYESIRRGARFGTLLKNLEQLQKVYADKFTAQQEVFEYTGLKSPFSMQAVVMKRNLREIARFPRFCKKFGMSELSLLHLVYDSLNDEDIFFNSDLTMLNELKRIVDDVQQECMELEINFCCHFKDYLNRKISEIHGVQTDFIKSIQSLPVIAENRATAETVEKEHAEAIRPESKHVLKCSKPWRNLHVSPNGDVRPHCECSIPIGNLLDDTFENVWNSEMAQYYRKELMGKTCQYKCSPKCVAGLSNIW